MFPAPTPQFEAMLAIVRDRIARSTASRGWRTNPDDLAQDVCIVLLRKYQHITDLKELVNVALGIMSKIAYGRWKTMVRRREHTAVPVDTVLTLSDTAETADKMLERKAMATRVAGAIARLGENCRTIIGFWMQGLSTEEISQELRLSSHNAAYLRLSRCRRQLKDLLLETQQEGI